jgi:hypothetical protein
MIFGSSTWGVAVGALVVFGLAFWYLHHISEPGPSDLASARSSTAAVARPSRELPAWLVLFQRFIHYPAMAAGGTGIALLLGDSSWIEKHTFTEPWATKIAGLAVLATAAFALAAGRWLRPEGSGSQSPKWRAPRNKNA